MKKNIILFSLILTILSINYIFAQNKITYDRELKNTSWEGYGKFENSLRYGKHKFEFDGKDKIVHYINDNVEQLYKWRVSSSKGFEIAKEGSFVYKPIEIELVNKYQITFGGMELRRTYN